MGAMFTVAPNIMSEAFDDETVVVNMDRGHYYALSGVSAQFWSKLSAGEGEADALSQGLTIDAGEIEIFLSLLAQEGLVSGHAQLESAQEPQAVLAGTAFAGTFERFTDVEQLLLADPIHDFEAGGWPTTHRA